MSIGLAVTQQSEAQVCLVTGQRSPRGKIGTWLPAMGYDESTVEMLKSLSALRQRSAGVAVCSFPKPNDGRKEEQ